MAFIDPVAVNVDLGGQLVDLACIVGATDAALERANSPVKVHLNFDAEGVVAERAVEYSLELGLRPGDLWLEGTLFLGHVGRTDVWFLKLSLRL